jgi:hypothetical protein
MGLQKYRADEVGETQKNGAVPCYTRWMGGPTLALIRNCPVDNRSIPPRTVYIRGEPDTFFSIPAACTYKGRTIRGYVTCDDNREFVFRAVNGQAEEYRYLDDES